MHFYPLQYSVPTWSESCPVSSSATTPVLVVRVTWLRLGLLGLGLRVDLGLELGLGLGLGLGAGLGLG